MGKLSKYIEKHGKPFSVSVPNGKGTLTVMFYEGYVVLRSNQPGVRFGQEISITLKCWRRLLPRLVVPTRLMKGPSFDRYRSERRYLASLALLEAEKRAAKRERHEEQRRQAQRQRALRARARAARTQAQDET